MRGTGLRQTEKEEGSVGSPDGRAVEKRTIGSFALHWVMSCPPLPPQPCITYHGLWSQTDWV